jgi:sugar phosphate isomerase/epimerase
MSTSPSPVVSSCREADADPVEVPAAALESTAPEYLRDLKATLAGEGKVPAGLRVEACFSERCSFATQEEAERVRDHVRAATFLGAGRVTVEVDAVAAPGKVRSALAAARERAEREGVRLEVEGVDL